MTLSTSDLRRFSSLLVPPPPPLLRAIFYAEHLDAAKTKSSVKGSAQDDKQDGKQEGDGGATSGTPQSGERYQPPTFPTEGWSSKKADFPRVSAGTIIFHLMKTGKSVQCSKKSGPIGDGSSELAEYDVQLVQKPLSRALDFVFDCYIHDEHVASVEGKTYLRSKCWASQKKYVKYIQKVVLNKEQGFYTVEYASCEGCPAGTYGGLCQHVFALLVVVESYGPDLKGNAAGPQSVTSMPCA